ncbi:class I SAM-dependent methyltransferase [Sphingobacterium pedocola]|uniref:SAM-dependent methyltransferase n=1 Tax=Sphingobacterium pedocola TaxID=2082722 RepID=A0ABR9T577_9SPHI|nr:SAM-dependent methyltransferase [Sphingobacterium pedocola]MBE8720494.1 SAM-dependent methyltransferase [Sphingobacterium pedocola]
MSTDQYFITHIQSSIQDDDFIKLSLGDYKGVEPDLKNIYVKPVLIKRAFKLSFTYRYKTRDITKNFMVEEAIEQIQTLLQENGFRMATLFTTKENTICQWNKKRGWMLKSEQPTSAKLDSLSHDYQKERKIGSTSKKYLAELRLTDSDGKVFKNAQDKWRQINHYIELLSSMLKELPADKELSVVDMGAGKGYLTFALYDYLNNELNKPASVVGVEYRDDLVSLCNNIASSSSFNKLSFVQGTIEDYNPTQELNVLIALHACDTATDDAIFKGITNGADLIVVAPCCHKQVRRQLEKVKATNDLDFMTQYGIFLERHAEMLTDGIRALILEYYGYQTKVLQFIADAHTPKNVMIVGVKKAINLKKQHEILAKLLATKAYFGMEYHYLERLCGLSS